MSSFAGSPRIPRKSLYMRRIWPAVVAAGILGATGVAAQTPSSAGPVPLSLADAVKRAAGATAPVELAKLQVEDAQARVREARSALLPSLSASAGWLNHSMNKNSFGIEFPTVPGQAPIPDLIGPFDTYDARFQVRQTILDVPSFLRVKAAGSVVASTDAQQDAASEAAAQRAAAAYLRSARAAAIVAARDADVALAKELESLAEAQTQAGVGTAIDVTRAKTQLVTAQGEAMVAQDRLEQAQIELARALGMDADTRFQLTDSLADLDRITDAPTEPAAAVEAALKRRPELVAEEARLESARQVRRAIRLERLPRLDLAADYGANGPTVGNTIRTGAVGVQLSLPILDGFRREARADEQDAAIRASEVRERDLRQQVEAEVKAALIELRSGMRQREIAAERLRLAEQELSQARERFANGVAGNIEVIDAQSSLIRARDADVDAGYATALARANLAKAVGAARAIRD